MGDCRYNHHKKVMESKSYKLLNNTNLLDFFFAFNEHEVLSSLVQITFKIHLFARFDFSL